MIIKLVINIVIGQIILIINLSSIILVQYEIWNLRLRKRRKSGPTSFF